MIPIEVGCPNCSTNNVIELEFFKPEEDGLAQVLFGFMEGAKIKHYAFTGKGKCSKCGKPIEVSLAVTQKEQ